MRNQHALVARYNSPLFRKVPTIDDVRSKNISISLSNIDHSVRIASAHAGDIIALPVAPFGD
jgi:hypothetical protein